MGQRHQVFLHCNNAVTAYHHQWCYGTLPLGHTKRIVQYQKNAYSRDRLGPDSGYYDLSEKFSALLGTSPSEGVYSIYRDITNELVSKEQGVYLDGGDNNDGITIIKVDGSKKVSYCFMFLDHQAKLPGVDPLTPINGEGYLRCYYDDKDKDLLRAHGLKLAAYLDKHAHLLSLEEVYKLFPKFYAEGIEYEAIKKAKRDELPLYISSKYPKNQLLVEKRLKK